MKRKSLTLKSPNNMKVAALIFAILFVVYPQVRGFTANTLHSVADIIQPEQ
jgi:hypothetical protein